MRKGRKQKKEILVTVNECKKCSAILAFSHVRAKAVVFGLSCPICGETMKPVTAGILKYEEENK